MTKNLVLLLVGIFIGAVAMRSYDSSTDSQLSERAQQQSLSPLSRSGDSQIEVTQQSDQQNGEIDETENPGSQQSAAAERSVAENLIENSTTPNRVETAGVAGVGSPGFETQTEDISQPRVIEGRGLPPLLPEDYYFMLEPPEDQPITTAERAVRFAEEARDESWAYTMELGINQHVAVATPVGTVIEYVECRTTTCMMAGYTQPGFENGSRALIGEMGRTGWWQLGGETVSVSRGRNGENRFVHFLTTDQDSGTETVPLEPQEDPMESTTQNETASSERV